MPPPMQPPRLGISRSSEDKPAEQPAPKKRGRPKGSKNKPRAEPRAELPRKIRTRKGAPPTDAKNLRKRAAAARELQKQVESQPIGAPQLVPDLRDEFGENRYYGSRLQAEIEARRAAATRPSLPAAPAIIRPPSQDYLLRADRYVRGVLAGAIDVCEFVRLACQRQLSDLERQGRPDWPYAFDEAEAMRCPKFIELLPHIKGPLAGENVRLEDWQCFRLTTVFGWLAKEDRRRRRFRRGYTEVPRGNGKSLESSGIGLFGLTADKEPGAEIYSAATTRDQAKIVFEVAQAQANRRPDFLSAFNVQVGAHSIFIPDKLSAFQPLSAEAKTLDGKNVHIGIVDELHAHPTRHVYDVLETALGKRLRSLLWIITTAGTDRAGICYEIRDYVIKVLRGIVTDESQFGIIYTLDEGDDPFIEKSWRKANPNWGVSVMPDVIEQLAIKAVNTPSAQSNFKTKHLNLWVSSSSPWLPSDKWDACANPKMRREDFINDSSWSCVIALDLASKIDFVARVELFQKIIDGAIHYRVFPKFYLPEAQLRESNNSQYTGWAISNYLEAMVGDTVDYATVEKDLIEAATATRAVQVGFDPWQAQQLAQNCAAAGLTMVEIRPTTQNFSPAMKEIEAAVRDGRLQHDGNPVLSWMAGNVVCYRTLRDEFLPRKEFEQNKIDGMVALISAVARAIVIGGAESKSVYEERGLLSI